MEQGVGRHQHPATVGLRVRDRDCVTDDRGLAAVKRHREGRGRQASERPQRSVRIDQVAPDDSGLVGDPVGLGVEPAARDPQRMSGRQPRRGRPPTPSRWRARRLPFITLRSPKPESIKFVKDFARRTGDAVVLSHTDVEVLALAYDLECERNGGDWRLRRVPGQKRVNGSPPVKVEQTKVEETQVEEKPEEGAQTVDDVEGLTQALQDTALGKEDMSSDPSSNLERPAEQLDPADKAEEEQIESSDSDSEGWITPSNIKKHQAKDESSTVSTKSESKTLQVATMTGDFAMQNVLLQINLNLLSPATCKRIAHLKQTILRCHGCFFTTKDMNKQFCPRCGKPTLTRVSCTTNDRGEVKLHLKANMQWNNRGNVFSIPKPVSGTSNQKWQGPRHGGGQGGWGAIWC